MGFQLIAVQAKMALEHYQSAETFEAKIMALTEAAVVGSKDDLKLIAFPELIGMPLLFTLQDFEGVRKAQSFSHAALRHMRRDWRGFLASVWTARKLGLASFYIWRARAAHLAYVAAFSKAAKTFGVTLVAGSTFLPHLEVEPSRGLYIADTRVHNTSYLFGPTGTELGRSRKCYLTRGSESRSGLSKGRPQQLSVFETGVGRLGLAICLDGFHQTVIDHFDGLGAEIIVQPSANNASWERPWPVQPSLTEGEAWLRHGLLKQLQGRLSLRYGVNPMLVADWLDLSFRGRSSILANTRFRDAAVEGYPGLLAIAATSTEEEIIRYQLP